MAIRSLVIDPGIKMGLAFLDGTELIGYNHFTAKGDSWEAKTKSITTHLLQWWPYWEPQQTFIEFPTFHFRGNIKSLIKLSFLIGRIAEALPGKVTLIPINSWKGTLPKPVTWKRAEKFFKIKGLKNDEGDAVAIASWLIKNKLIV